MSATLPEKRSWLTMKVSDFVNTTIDQCNRFAQPNRGSRLVGRHAHCSIVWNFSSYLYLWRQSISYVPTTHSTSSEDSSFYVAWLVSFLSLNVLVLTPLCKMDKLDMRTDLCDFNFVFPPDSTRLLFTLSFLGVLLFAKSGFLNLSGNLKRFELGLRKQFPVLWQPFPQ